MQAAKLAGPATLAVSGALLFVALFFGDGTSDGRLFWLGAFAVLGVIVLLGWSVPVPRGCRARMPGAARGARALGRADDGLVGRARPLLGRVQPAPRLPARSPLLGVLATQVPQPARTIAAGLALLLGLVLCWALLGKVIPSLFPDGARVARLRNPIGYWNSLALAAATAVPLALWLASARGHARWVRDGGRVAPLRGRARGRAHLLARRHRGRRARGPRLGLRLARPARVARCAGRRDAGRRARRALGVLAAGAGRRPPGVRRPRERRRLVRGAARRPAPRSRPAPPTGSPGAR